MGSYTGFRLLGRTAPCLQAALPFTVWTLPLPHPCLVWLGHVCGVVCAWQPLPYPTPSLSSLSPPSPELSCGPRACLPHKTALAFLHPTPPCLFTGARLPHDPQWPGISPPSTPHRTLVTGLSQCRLQAFCLPLRPALPALPHLYTSVPIPRAHLDLLEPFDVLTALASSPPRDLPAPLLGGAGPFDLQAKFRHFPAAGRHATWKRLFLRLPQSTWAVHRTLVVCDGSPTTFPTWWYGSQAT